MDAEALVRPVIEGEGFELVDVALTRDAGRNVLRVTVDSPDGLDLDTVSELSLKVSRELDDVDFGTGPYALEVSSPGIERRLKNPAHFIRATGQLTKVKTVADPESGPAVHTGVLLQADDEGIVVLDGDREIRLAYGDIASASTIADWDAELKRSHP